MGYVGKVAAGGSTHLVGSTLFGICDNLANTAAKTVTCTDFDTLVSGVTIHVLFTQTNTASNPTLNVNSTGAYPIVYKNSTAVYDLDETALQKGVTAFTFIQSEAAYPSGAWVANDFSPSYDQGTVAQIETGTSMVPRVFAPKDIHDYVASQMGDVAGALVYKGTVSAGTELLNTALNKGWYYIVDTAGSYAGATCEPGDMIIVNTAGTYTTASALSAAVDIIQTNIDTISNSEIDTIVSS